MDWPYRLVGLIVIFGLVLSAIAVGATELMAITDNEGAQGDQELVTKQQGTVGKAGPAQLAFTEGGFNTGTHRIRPDESLFVETDDDERDDSGDGNDEDDDRDDSVDGNDEDDERDDSGDDNRDSEVKEPEPSGPHSGGLDPGLYTTTFDAEDCSYRLMSSGDVPFEYLYEPDPYDDEDYVGRRVGRDDQVIAVTGEDHLHQGRMLVSILGVESKSFTSATGCGSWMPWSPLLEPLTIAGDGDYWIGDLAQGEWSVPPGCLWEKVVAFRGARIEDVVDSDRGPGAVMIDEGTAGLRIRQCQGQSLVRIGDAAPYVPYVHPGPAEELTDER